MMFPPTPDRLAEAADVRRPGDATSPGAAWLMATAARAAEVQQHLNPCRVVADLGLRLCPRAHATSDRFAAEVALFRVARSLLDNLTTLERI